MELGEGRIPGGAAGIFLTFLHQGKVAVLSQKGLGSASSHWQYFMHTNQ